MKRIQLTVLCLVVALLMAGCGSGSDANPPAGPSVAIKPTGAAKQAGKQMGVAAPKFNNVDVQSHLGSKAKG